MTSMTSSCFHIFIQKQPPANMHGMTAQQAAVPTLQPCDPHTEQSGHQQPGASGPEAPHPKVAVGLPLIWCLWLMLRFRTDTRQMKPLCFSENGLSHIREPHHSSRFLPQAALGPALGATYFLTNHWATLQSSLPQLQALITVGAAGATQTSLLACFSSQRATGRSSCPESFQVVLGLSRC